MRKRGAYGQRMRHRVAKRQRVRNREIYELRKRVEKTGRNPDRARDRGKYTEGERKERPIGRETDGEVKGDSGLITPTILCGN
jgi:hypothetical protein